MAKVMLFLYPCEAYIKPLEEDAKKHYSFFQLNEDGIEKCLDGINREIAKYRNGGYEIYFVLFSNGNKIEHNLISSRINIEENDKLIHADISWEMHKLKKYPNEDYVLNQLPTPIDKLVIGGFHRDDCCRRIETAVKRKGVNVEIDSDLTEYFYTRKILQYFERVSGLSLEEVGKKYGYE